MKKKFSKFLGVSLALVLVLSFSLVTAVPVSAADTPTIDAVIDTGEWDGALEIPVADGMGTVKLLASTDYLYVLFDVIDPTDNRLGSGYGNDKIGLNINPTLGLPYGKPCDIVFQTGTDPAAFNTPDPDPEGSSGLTDGWETEWVVEGVQLNLPPDLETMTLYSEGTRISEWRVPLASIAPSLGDALTIAGACDNLGDSGDSFKYPPTLDWSDVLTYVDYSFKVENEDTGLYYQTIQLAIDAASSGDTILVAAGIYNEDVTINKSLTLISAEGKENTTINGQSTSYTGAVVVTAGTSNVIIGDTSKGFTVNGTGQAAIYALGNNDSITIRDNKVVTATANALLFGCTGGGQSNHTIDGNELISTHDAGQVLYIDGEASHPGGDIASSNVDITNNTFKGHVGGGVLLGTEASGNIFGNDFTESSSTYARLELWVSGADVKDNIFEGTPLGTVQVRDGSGTLNMATVVEDNTFDRAVLIENGNIIWSSIQDAVNVAVTGDTVDVAAGLYNERLTINESLDLRGAQYGKDPTAAEARMTPADESIIDVSGLPIVNPHIAVEIQNGVNNVAVDGFTIIGVPTSHHADDSCIRCGESSGTNGDIAISNNIIDGYVGILFNNGDGLTVHRNRMVVNKNGVVIHTGASAAIISDNLITFGILGSEDEAGIYMTSCSQSSVTGNTITGFPHNAALHGSNLDHLAVSGNTFTGNAAGISIFGGSTFITITDNELSDSLISSWGDSGCGICIKGADLIITGNQITNNADKGVKIDYHQIATERVTISNNNIVGNTNYGVWVNTAKVTETVDASMNWWGDAGGPGADLDEDAVVGDAVSSNVNYDPWITGDIEPGAVDSADVSGYDTGEVNLQDDEDNTIAKVDISGGDVTEGTITAFRYTDEPAEETSLSVGTGTAGVVFLDVKVTGYTEGWAHITVPYPDVEPAGGDGIVDDTDPPVYEHTLGLYYWDEAGMWRIAGNNTVHPVANTVSGYIPVSALGGTPIILGGYEALVAIESILNLNDNSEENGLELDTVKLTIDTNIASVTSATIDLIFDPRVVEVLGVVMVEENGKSVAESAFEDLRVKTDFEFTDDGFQIARFLAYQTGAGVDATGSVVVAEVKLKAVGSTMDFSPLHLDVITLKDEGNWISRTGATSIAIVGGVGDANRDTYVDIADLVRIEWAILGIQSEYGLTMNVDGKDDVDAADCTYLARHLVSDDPDVEYPLLPPDEWWPTP